MDLAIVMLNALCVVAAGALLGTLWRSRPRGADDFARLLEAARGAGQANGGPAPAPGPPGQPARPVTDPVPTLLAPFGDLHRQTGGRPC